jgi:hypothetical protein
MDNYPFTSVYRGRVISVTDRQRVQGGGVVLGGWGGMRVDTVTFNEFWLKSPDFGDLCFKMGSAEIPPMLRDHAVTVVVAGTEVCAVANHSTGVQRFYRPKGIYRVNKGGALFLLPALIILAVLEFSGYRALVQAAQGTVIVAWLVLVGVINLKVLRYNARLDKRLQALIDVARTEQTANAREVNAPSLPWKEA